MADSDPLAHVPEHARVGLAAMRYAPIEDRPDKEAAVRSILERMLNDERAADVAADYGISLSGLYFVLVRHALQDWKDVQAARALTGLELAEDRLRTAQDGLELTRAREQARAAQWRLERVLRVIYGQDAPAVVGAAVQINVTVAPQGEQP